MTDRPRPLHVVSDDHDAARTATEYHVVRDDRPRREEPDRRSATSTAQPRSDRRQFARHSLALRVELRFESLDAAVHSETVDLSRSGVFLRTEFVRALGTAVQLGFELEGRRLDVCGVVVRQEARDGKPVGMAIAFDEPIAADAGIFDALIEQRAARAAR